MWSIRCVHEASLHSAGNGSSFVTLTYRDRANCTREQLEAGQHVPDSWSLDKRHFQLFMKRLRKSRPGARLKYYHCGEYGRVCKHGFDLERQECPLCKHGRPHYHAIIFNCSFPDSEVYATRRGEPQWTSRELEKLWGNGFVTVGEVTPQSAAYVARYCLKKVNGEMAEDHYRRVTEDGEVIDLQPEYATMSNGIGAGWYEKFKSDVYPSDEVPVPGASQPIHRKAPRYYDELLKRADPVMHEALKQRRQEHKLENPDEYSRERLLSKYKVKKDQIGNLKRNL